MDGLLSLLDKSLVSAATDSVFSSYSADYMSPQRITIAGLRLCLLSAESPRPFLPRGRAENIPQLKLGLAIYRELYPRDFESVIMTTEPNFPEWFTRIHTAFLTGSEWSVSHVNAVMRNARVRRGGAYTLPALIDLDAYRRVEQDYMNQAKGAVATDLNSLMRAAPAARSGTCYRCKCAKPRGTSCLICGYRPRTAASSSTLLADDGED